METIMVFTFFGCENSRAYSPNNAKASNNNTNCANCHVKVRINVEIEISSKQNLWKRRKIFCLKEKIYK